MPNDPAAVLAALTGGGAAAPPGGPFSAPPGIEDPRGATIDPMAALLSGGQLSPDMILQLIALLAGLASPPQTDIGGQSAVASAFLGEGGPSAPPGL